VKRSELRPNPDKVREWMHRSRKPQRQPIGDPTPKACKQCGETFTPRRSPLGWTVYCSTRCGGLGRQQRVVRACTVCSTEFETGGRLGDRKTCSPNCARAAKSRGKRGERNPNYLGERAGQRRWTSPPLVECLLCGTGKRLQRHHVVFEQVVRREGGDPFDPRDQVTLCIQCHVSVHKATRKPLAVWMLPDAAIEFAGELLGPGAYDYLRRRYSGDDHRVDALLNLPVRDRG
jgi:hypothetical protein